MTARPHATPDTTSQSAGAAGIGAVVLGALVAVDVAALLLVLTRAERTHGRPA